MTQGQDSVQKKPTEPIPVTSIPLPGDISSIPMPVQDPKPAKAPEREKPPRPSRPSAYGGWQPVVEVEE